MLALWLAGALALGGEALTPQQIVEAEWSRDAAVLLAGPYRDADLPRVARALGRLGDPAALERLELLADQSDPAVRHEAVVALGNTPGAGPALRERLDRVADPEQRATLVRALGRRGGPGDVARLAGAAARSGPEGRAACDALARMARRGIDVDAAVPEVVGALGGLDVVRTEACAHALHRIRPSDLAAADVARVERTWRATPSEAAKAWLVPTLIDHLDARRRRVWFLEVLAGPYRLVQAAILAPGVGEGSWPRDELEGLLGADDPWLRLRARERLGPDEAADALAAARSAAARGEATETQIRALVAAARTAEAPSERSRAAAALLGGDPDWSWIDQLVGAADPVVRELTAHHLGERGGTAAAHRLELLLVAEGDVATRLAILDALAAVGRPPGPGARAALERLVLTGSFLVRQRAAEVAAALDVPVSEPEPVLPGPVDLVRDLDAIGTLVSARVLTSRGEVRIALEPDVAPLAVAVFAHLARADAYDGGAFHRVVPGFVVQTGDDRGDGMGSPGWFVPDETSDRAFDAGVVGMATAGPDAGGAQWFVTLAPQPHLVGDYTRFGRVTHGLDVVRRLSPDDVVLDVVIEPIPPEPQ